MSAAVDPQLAVEAFLERLTKQKKPIQVEAENTHVMQAVKENLSGIEECADRVELAAKVVNEERVLVVRIVLDGEHEFTVGHFDVREEGEVPAPTREELAVTGMVEYGVSKEAWSYVNSAIEVEAPSHPSAEGSVNTS